MKRVLFGMFFALLALSILAACQNNDADGTDKPSSRTTPIVSVTVDPPPITVTEPPKPHTTIGTVNTTELPHPSTTEPPVTTTQPVTTPIVTTTAVTTGTGPVLGSNDNHTDWGPIVPMEPMSTTTVDPIPAPPFDW